MFQEEKTAYAKALQETGSTDISGTTGASESCTREQEWVRACFQEKGHYYFLGE